MERKVMRLKLITSSVIPRDFSNCSFLVETGYWVPGAPGPLVWGDLLGKLETEQRKYQETFPTKLNVTDRDP